MMLATIGIIDFALRKFDLEGDKNSKDLDTRIRCDPQDFVRYVKDHFTDNSQLKEGYAPFCKHLFVPNKFPVIPGAIKLTDQIKHVLHSGYQARTSDELPVLSRWVTRQDVLSLGTAAAPAKFIDVILYSHDQVVKEMIAMKQDPSSLEKADWFIISLKFQDEETETPMMPITCMRNALISEGGSGVEIDRKEYLKSVAFWEEHVEVQ
eukprot:Gregarina_sp_Pseudo_9__1510@NODE_2014_length_1201_cov_12_124785_g1860_i0_p1_GENE_NODE_2014_length_1201_cov_12_124785_g1860_i0NODE_2014_length_1201_cov_12_124785_g1860_i0_p1_ORF_typecomplete_len208_score29_34DUF3228/PF11539_8/4e68_NODE_2014_length_1201_cov_12_124785_g1860_i05031126